MLGNRPPMISERAVETENSGNCVILSWSRSHWSEQDEYSHEKAPF